MSTFYQIDLSLGVITIEDLRMGRPQGAILDAAAAGNAPQQAQVIIRGDDGFQRRGVENEPQPLTAVIRWIIDEPGSTDAR